MDVSAPSSAPTAHATRASPLLVLLCQLAVYLIWGSTYLAIRFALEGYAPLFFPGLRFLLAGTVLLAILKLRGAPWPNRRQWLNAAMVSVLLLNIGNGAVVFAERSVGSGLAATAVATVPLWTALAAGLWGEWPRALQWLGMLIGLAGVVVLNLGSGFAGSPWAAVLLVASSITWAFGSVWSKRLDMPSGLMSSACQMFTAGILFLIASAAVGEPWHLTAPAKAMASLLYLSIAGSLVAFSAYIYLVQHVSPALATSNTYVNPVVAVLIGFVVGGETFSFGEMIALALVVIGVVLIIAFNRSKGAPPAVEPEA